MFELATSVILMIQAFSPVTADAASASLEVREKPINTIETYHALTLEEYVRETFKDEPMLAEIAKCESHFRQFNDNGTVLRGRVNNGDIGIMQINRYYHEDDAVKLGFDIYTIEGNIGFAKKLHEKYGNKPWVHSKKCWGKSELALAR